MKAKGATPQVGQAAVSRPPARMANNIFRILEPLADPEPVEGPLFFLCLFIQIYENSGKGTIFWPIFAQILIR